MSVLEGRGVDVGKVKISKAEVALWGYALFTMCSYNRYNVFCSIEQIGRFKKKQSKMIATARKDAAVATKHVVNAIPRNEMNDDETSLWKLEILEGRKERRRNAAEDRPCENIDSG